MRGMQRVPVAGALVLAAAGTAAAGGFGGFSEGGDAFLQGQEQVCEPIPVEDGRAVGLPSCERPGPAAVARQTFVPGDRAADVTAEVRGTKVEVRREGGASFTWAPGVPVARVTGARTAQGGQLVALEYEVRRGGRLATGAVAFSLDSSAGTATRDGFAVFREIAALAGPPTAYERLVGKGGHWEQASVPCDQPKVFLDLEPKDRSFALTIESRCRGRSNVTELAGPWTSRGRDRLILTFPTPKGADETLVCPIDTCDDGSGEDCLRCQPARDLSFVLRIVRRGR